MKNIFWLIVFLQIFLLINFSVAQSYFIAESNGLSRETKIEENKIKDLIGTGIKFLFWITSLNELKMVSAIDSGCCEKTTGGQYCVDAPAECSSSYFSSPKSCIELYYCDGVCYDSENGVCTPDSSKSQCEGDGGVWSKTGNQNSCQKGCCLLEKNTKFLTSRQCEVFSDFYSMAYDFDLSISEKDCRYFSLEEGACIYDEELCVFTSEKNCAEKFQGQFNKNSYCSDLLDNHITHASTECVVGQKDVYWFDSRGQREEINKTCIFGEETCAINSAGKGYCKDLGCDWNGEEKKNGESWCIYDGYVGNGKDLVGSEHYMASCVQGEIEIQSSHYRDLVCAEKTPEGAIKSTAQLRTNLGFMCYQYENKEECDTNPDCNYFSVNVDKQFKFDVCVPNYPKGFDIYAKDRTTNGQEICKLATQTCTVIEEKGFDLSWHCKVNCDCRTAEFSQKMNEFCMSLGDCGSYINYAGTRTNNMKVTGGLQELCEDVSTGSFWKKLICRAVGFTKTKEALEKEDQKYLTKENTEENAPVFLRVGSDIGNYMDEVSFFNKEVGNTFGDSLKGNWDLATTFFSYGRARAVILANSWNPIGWATAIALAIAAVVDWLLGLFGIGDTREKKIKFTCEVWDPPIGGEDCEKCNADPLKECTEYRCEMLGTSCGILEETLRTENPLCRNVLASDIKPPTISFKEIEGNYKKTPISGGVSIKKSDNTCISKYKKVNLTIETDEETKCFWDEERREDYEAMAGEFIRESDFVFAKEHKLENLLINKENKYEIHIMCLDPAGNSDEFLIEFCVTPIPDENGPIIENFVPASGSYLRLEETTKLVTLYLDEPANCKYSSTNNIDYADMSLMSCNAEQQEPGVRSSCEIVLSELTQAENKIYFLCNDTLGNMQESMKEYTLLQTPSALTIVSVSALEELKTKTFELEVVTSGGVDNGDSTCSYSGAGYRDFLEGEKTEHTYYFSQFPEGKTILNITCEDSARNIATREMEINVDLDTEPPKVVRVFHSDGKLKIITNEQAECFYSLEKCNFNLENGTDMTIASSLIHTATWIEGKTYYIKCKDFWDNENPTCAIRITPEY